MNAEKTARERENKRRFRSRRKEYVAELEKTVQDLRNEGVQATKEMQASARRVAHENIRLRALLSYRGVGENVIEAWVREDPSLTNSGSSLLNGNLIKLPLGCQKGNTKEIQKVTCSSNTCLKAVDAKPIVSHLPSPESTSPASTNEDNPKVVQSLQRIALEAPEKTCSSQSGKTCTKNTTPKPLPGACMLVSHLSNNPSLDITQIPSLQAETTGSDELGGVECAKAYKMLMQYATSDEKLENIAQVLESGCVANRSGGCKVRNEVIWKALDDMQQD